MQFTLFRFVVFTAVATGSADVKNVSCSFSNSRYMCGYISGASWATAVVSYSESSGNVLLLLVGSFYCAVVVIDICRSVCPSHVYIVAKP